MALKPARLAARDRGRVGVNLARVAARDKVRVGARVRVNVRVRARVRVRLGRVASTLIQQGCEDLKGDTAATRRREEWQEWGGWRKGGEGGEGATVKETASWRGESAPRLDAFSYPRAGLRQRCW